MKHKARRDIGGLILVNDIRLCKLVQHLLYARQLLCGSGLVGRSAEFANSITHGLCVIFVMERTRLCLTDSSNA